MHKNFSKKEQIKLFVCCCLAEDPFVLMLKEKKIPIQCWAYVNAIRKWRDDIRKILESKMGNPTKEAKTVRNKILYFFSKVEGNEIGLLVYLNFVILVVETIREKVKGLEKHLWEKMLENLFKLYCYFDPDIKEEESMNEAIKWNNILEEIF